MWWINDGLLNKEKCEDDVEGQSSDEGSGELGSWQWLEQRLRRWKSGDPWVQENKIKQYSFL